MISQIDMILLLIDLPCVYVCFRLVHLMHYKLKLDKQMLHLARLSFLIVTCSLDSFSWGTRANNLHIKVTLDIVID